MLRVLLISVMLVSMARCAARLDPCGNLWGPSGSPEGKTLPQTFTSDAGRFKIGLPAMSDRPEAGDEPRGENDKSFKLFVINRGQFEVRYVDRPWDLEAPDVRETIINSLRDHVRSRGEGQFEVDTEISLAGHPGRELRYRDERGLLIQRIYLVSKRMYLVTAFVPDRMVGCAGADVIKRLDTFEIIEENDSTRIAQ